MMDHLRNELAAGKGDRIMRGVTTSLDQLPLRIQMITKVIADRFAPRLVNIHGSYWHGYYDTEKSDLDLWIEDYAPDTERDIIDAFVQTFGIKIDAAHGNNAIHGGLGVEVRV